MMMMMHRSSRIMSLSQHFLQHANPATERSAAHRMQRLEATCILHERT